MVDLGALAKTFSVLVSSLGFSLIVVVLVIRFGVVVPIVFGIFVLSLLLIDFYYESRGSSESQPEVE